MSKSKLVYMAKKRIKSKKSNNTNGIVGRDRELIN